MTLFELWATLGLDTTEFKTEADKAVKEGENLGERMTTKMGAKSVLLGNVLTNVTRSFIRTGIELMQGSIEIASEIEAENAQFRSAFGEMQEAAEEAYGAIGEQANILPTRLRAVGTKGYSQLKSAGLEADEALEQSARMMSLAADAAAYYDITLEAADERIRSFLRGNTEAGDAIGLFTSENDRNTRALEKYGRKWADLNEQQRQMLMLDTVDAIYSQSGALGQAARESNSWANATANLSEAWRQTLGILGGPLQQELIPVIEKLQKWLLSNEDTFESVAAVIGQIASVTFDGLISAFEWIKANGESLIGTFQSIFSFFGGGDRTNPVSEGQTFGDLNAKEAVQRWIEGAATEDYRLPELWAEAESALGGQEAASSFVNAYSVYLEENHLEWGADLPESWFSDTQAQMQSNLDQMSLTVDANVNPILGGIGSWVGNFFSGLGSDADGLDYVPFNGYRTELHAGEAVLTRQEAENWRSGGSGGASADEIAAAVSSALEGKAVVLGDQIVGVLTDRIDRSLSKKTKMTRRYAAT